jgi:hypothetical protein
MHSSPSLGGLNKGYLPTCFKIARSVACERGRRRKKAMLEEIIVLVNSSSEADQLDKLEAFFPSAMHENANGSVFPFGTLFSRMRRIEISVTHV